MRRPSIPYSAIPFPRARAERVNEVLSPAQEQSHMILDPRDPPADFEDDEDEFEDEEEEDEED